LRRAAWLAAAALLVPGIAVSAAAAPGQALPPAPAAAAGLPTSWPAVPDVADRLQPWLAGTLATAPADEPLRVMVSGETTAAATAAAQAAGLTIQQSWAKVGIVVGIGVPAQVRAVLAQPGVTYVEGDEPLAYSLDTAHKATRSAEALEAVTGPDGARVDGTGVTIAVIDSGIDSSHPMFKRGAELTKVVKNLKNACGITFDDALNESCFQPVSDTDSVSAGGHGTHVAGIAAGYEVTTTNPAVTKLRGAAPGAKLVGLSVGAAIGLLDSNAAMYWVVEHQNKPCKPKTQQDGAPEPECPPIRVTNHSYGPATAPEEGFTFDEDSATVRIQRTLVEKGVTPVWAAGNSAGDGEIAQTNPPGMDPTPGVLMVASYNDGGAGNRDNQLSGSPPGASRATRPPTRTCRRPVT
jgi:serine protease AprX